MLLLPAPLPAIGAALVAAGLLSVGRRVARLFRPDPTPLDAAAGFVLAAGFVASATTLAAWAGALARLPFRAAAALLAAAGVAEIVRQARRAARALPGRLTALRIEPLAVRAAAALSAAIGVSLALAALGPPTDADSLDYHLGVPLDALLRGRAAARPDWYTARLAGAGESLNLFGLAFGSDVFGAVLQAAALAALLGAVRQIATSARKRALGALLVLGCPLMLFLVPNQKPQLLPAAAVTIALVLALERRGAIDFGTVALASGCAAFAIACKYSFFGSGAIVLFVVLAAARGRRRIPAAGIVAAGLAIFALPGATEKLAFYGDPATPLFESWKRAPDAGVLRFARYLRVYESPRDAAALLRLPFRLIATAHPADFSTMLGLGALAVVLVFRIRGTPRLLLGAAVASAAVTLLFGQWTARFFLEPYLWAALAVISATPAAGEVWFLRGLLLQGGAVAAVAAWEAALLFPAAFSAARREAVMRRAANESAAIEWARSVLPPDATVLSDLRSSALLLPRFVSAAALFERASPRTFPQDLIRYAREHGATVGIFRSDPIALGASGLTPLAPARSFPPATRNPYNRGSGETIRLFRIAPDGDSGPVTASGPSPTDTASPRR